MLKHLFATVVAAIVGLTSYAMSANPHYVLGFIAVWAISGVVAEILLIACSLTFCSGRHKLYTL